MKRVIKNVFWMMGLVLLLIFMASLFTIVGVIDSIVTTIYWAWVNSKYKKDTKYVFRYTRKLYNALKESIEKE